MYNNNIIVMLYFITINGNTFETTISTDLPKYLVPLIGIGLESLKN